MNIETHYLSLGDSQAALRADRFVSLLMRGIVRMHEHGHHAE